jgi:hypothetical protein
VSRSVLMRMRNVSVKCCVENKNTHFIFKIFFCNNRAVCETRWKNIFERTDHGWRCGAWELHAGCLSTHTHTHTEYVISIAFPPQQWLYERASSLPNTLPILFFMSSSLIFQIQRTFHLIWNSFVTRFVYGSHKCRYSFVLDSKPTHFLLNFSLTKLHLVTKLQLFAQNALNGRRIVKPFFPHFSSPKLLNVFLRTLMMRFCTEADQEVFFNLFCIGLI